MIRLNLFILAVVGLTEPSSLLAQNPDAAVIFDQHQRAITQVQVIGTNSNAKSATGTGFFVSNAGHLVTNYHVVSTWILDTDDNRIVLVRDGDSIDARVLAIDVVNDVAILETDHRPTHIVQFARVTPRQGAPLYSFGYPGELGLTIVGGTYNGRLEHSLHDRVHFTGSLNPGMSGGPTVDGRGRVVGINVSTAGNQMSFLVPGAAAQALLERATASDYSAPKDFKTDIGAQLTANQDRYLDQILAEPFPTTSLDQFEVPTQPAPFFNCWGDTSTDENERWDYIGHQCTTIDRVFVSPSYSGAVLRLYHSVLRTDSLNTFRFYNLFSNNFNDAVSWMGRDSPDVTDYTCTHDNVRYDDHVILAALCLRGLTDFPGLYDVIFKAASLGVDKSGLETTLEMSAVGFDKARDVARAILEAISWP